MKDYAFYVWTSYALSALVIGALVVHSLHALRKATRAEKERRR